MEMEMEKSLILDSYKRRRACNEKTEVCEKKEKQEAFRRVSKILRKCETLRTSDESRVLESATDIVKQILNRKTRLLQSKERVLEKEDPQDVIENKARELAEVISRARHLVCYTGAGISTSARIPDYRGSKGIWTLLQQGKDIGEHDLSLAEPTYTHMALYELHRRNILRHVVSQNCDGLHLRSGLPKSSLAEVHGNMYVEVCKNCKPNAEYWRLFDTTELTARYYHKTNRRCHLCGTPLVDTIVHFGERGSLRWPLNWDGAMLNADKADVILCMGSSLKVLKKYSWLWSMDRPKGKRPQIYIVNLQWTPKDATATMKINGKCDEVMQLVMKYMNITVPDYNRRRDPIFAHASLLASEELHTRSQPMLQGYKDSKKDSDGVSDESEGNDSKSRSSEDSNDKMAVTLPHQTPILRDDTKLVVPKEIVANGKDFSLSCDRLKVNSRDETTADAEAPVENNRDIQTTCSTNGFVSTNGTHSTETPLRSNGCSAETIHDDLHPEIVCDKKPLNDSSPGNLASVSNVQSVPVPQKDQIIDPIKLPPVSDGVDRTNDCNSSIKTPSPTKLTSRDVCLLNKSKDRHKKLIDFCKLSCHLPHWYDSNYAYSGLHSIIYPPPTEVDLWESDVVPIFHLNRSDAECDFCFDNYAENSCQFYRPKTTEFLVTSCRKGRVVLCECCDYTDESDSENTLEYQDAKRIKLDGAEFIKDEKESVKVQAGWFGKGYRKMFRRKRRA